MVTVCRAVAPMGQLRPRKSTWWISVDSTAQVERQVKIQEAGVGTGTQHDALLGLRLGASLIRGQAGGATDGPILAGQLAREQFLSRGVGGDFLVGQER